MPQSRHLAPGRRLLVTATAAALTALLLLLLAGSARAASVEPVFVPGNPTCSSVGLGSAEYKIDPPQQGVTTYAFGGLQVKVTVTGLTFAWEITSGAGSVINGVVVKGGPNANVYAYGAGGATSDTMLHAPVNPSNGKFYGLSHISFCRTPATTGTIEIVKQTDPDGAEGTFAFTSTGGLSTDQGGFTLQDDGTKTFSAVAPGSYTVSETAQEGWTLQSLVCTDPTGNTTIQGATATIAVAAGETVRCVYTNKKDVPPPPGKATIIVKKVTDPAGAPDTFAFTSPLDQDGFDLSDGQTAVFGELEPGTYTVDETAKDGWTLEGVSCVDPTNENAPVASGGDPEHDVSVTVAAGQVVRCTFTNRKVVPPTKGTIAITKLTTPAGATDLFPFTTTGGLTPAGFSLSGGQTTIYTDVEPGAYSVTEGATVGWKLDGVQCTETGSPAEGNVAPVVDGATATLNVAAGESVSCTYTNSRITPPDVPVTPSGGQVGSTTASGGVAPTTASGGAVTRASLSGPAACVRSRYTLKVSGRPVRGVTIYVNGKVARRLTAKTGQQTFSVTLNASGARVQKVRAVVRFSGTTQTKTLRRTVFKCRAANAVRPQFTG
ncbi:MAG: hypothetical protein MUC84_01230 [Solirubrobacteraceae bacterium]|jgi:hypothetical protein|nr:hypothetical protein [Solirubrobacteraceae bacterium]